MPGAATSCHLRVRPPANDSRPIGADTQVRPYEDVPGFCKSVTIEAIRKHRHVLTPGRYVGIAEAEEDDEPFEEKMERLVGDLAEQQRKAAELDAVIWRNLEGLGYGT